MSAKMAAQTTQLQLSLTNDKQEPFQNASVALYQLPDSILKEKKVIKGNGSFDVDTQTNYLIKISAAGTQNISKEIRIADSSVTITVILSAKVSSLGNVTVVSKRPLIKQDDDKTVVDAEALANSSSNAFEVL